MKYLVSLAGQHLIFALSSDAKTPDSPDGSVLLEMDTGIVYKLQSSVWTPLSSGPVPAAINPAELVTTSIVTTIVPNASYRTILQASGSHIAGRVAGKYALAIGNPLAISGTGTLYPLQLININATDYPVINGVATKLRVRAIVSVNGVAPTGNFTVGLYPVTSGAGGAGVKIYTLGTLVPGSGSSTVTAPIASSMSSVVSFDFTLPADGIYCIGVVTTTTVAASSLVHINASLQMRNA